MLSYIVKTIIVFYLIRMIIRWIDGSFFSTPTQQRNYRPQNDFEEQAQNFNGKFSNSKQHGAMPNNNNDEYIPYEEIK
jgi:hypothetical protein